MPDVGDRLGPASPPILKSPTHHTCVSCAKRLAEADMISDDKGRWWCWECTERVYGITRDG